MHRPEFEEIAHTGGKISFINDPEKGTSIKISSSNPWAATIHQICVSYEGEILDFVPATGIGPMRPYPQPSIIVFLLSDMEGLFGQVCPECKTYFRVSHLSSLTTCPYCGNSAHGIDFLTKNQIQFAQAFCNDFIKSHTERNTIEIDLNNIVNNLDNNTQGWVYSEERQQSLHRCSNCRCSYDILGDYGVCPSCSTPNYQKILDEKFDKFEEQFKKIDEEITDRHEREVEWEKLTRCVSEFEALANTIKSHLAILPMHPKRKSSLSNLSFQNILVASDKMQQWFCIDILNGVSQEDRTFLNKMFNRRHVFTHNAGKVDQEYINNTGDTSVRINQVIKLRSREIKRLIPLVKKCASNLIRDFSSLK